MPQLSKQKTPVTVKFHNAFHFVAFLFVVTYFYSERFYFAWIRISPATEQAKNVGNCHILHRFGHFHL